MTLKRLLPLAFALLFTSISLFAAAPKPLRVLLVAGGCCHDYLNQKEILKEGLEARAHVVVDFEFNPDKSTGTLFDRYKRSDWAKGYDVVIHDECSASVKDIPYVENILRAHRDEGVPAVNLHCAMHCYRTGKDDWFKFVGIQSSAHGPQEPIAISFTEKTHPIVQTLTDWTTIKEELYNNVKSIDGSLPLARGKQLVKQKDGTTKEVVYDVAWANQFGKARVFSTTIGHNNETVGDARYLNLLTRGLLWACGKLNDEYLKPAGANTTPTAMANLIKAPAAPVLVAPPAKPIAYGDRPNLAVAGTASASSEESGKSNFAWKAIDGSASSRWCASSGAANNWWQVDLGKEQKITGVVLDWESRGGIYRYRVEGSIDGKQWKPLVDAERNEAQSPNQHDLTASVRYVRVTHLGTKRGGWASLWEVAVLGEKGAPQPAVVAQNQGTGSSAAAKGNKKADKAAQQKSGDADKSLPTPDEVAKMPAVVPEKAATLIKEVKVPVEFDATIFATPPAVNYPVFVAAAPDGTLYVSSDGNGSLGREPNRGRILRVRDTNGDGKADEVRVFVKNVDSPRGLFWDHDRVICLHPPHVSAFIDRDGDGIADEEKILIKGIAFGFADRPADHTSNGIELGVDGWIYCAIGDFGFMEAVGTDGRKLQLRGGGVVRFRPDGTGLQLFARGTRNILEVAVSPLLDIMTRDNTNDGGGWDVRFHHFTGFEDHGYPRLYKNFASELIAPLADYGGGSGCGAAWLDEPGIPAKWNNSPLTADWGRGWLYQHRPTPKGATFSVDQNEFIGLTRPTDADVDALSRIYVSSWKGATFNWAGNDVGYVVRVTPKNFKPEPLPNFANAGDAELVKLLESSSHRRRLEAQRTLIRHGLKGDSDKAVGALAADKSKPLASRVAAIFALKQSLGEKSHATLAKLAADSTVAAWALRALSDREDQLNGISADLLVNALKSADERTRREAVVALARWHGLTGIWADNDTPKLEKIRTEKLAEHSTALAKLLGDKDPVIVHTAMQVLRQLKASDATFAIVDTLGATPQEREYALLVLSLIRDTKTVDGLIERLGRERELARRKGLLTALSRQYFVDGEWKGDSWGTRPDTRGPFYQPEKWAQTEKISGALKTAFNNAKGEELTYLASELNRHRVDLGDTLGKLIAAAKADAAALPALVGQLSRGDNVPTDALPLLIQAANKTDLGPQQLGQTIVALTKVQSDEGTRAALTALPRLQEAKGFGKDFDTARDALFNSPKLDVNHAALEAEAAKLDGKPSQYADAALISLLDRKSGSPEALASARKAIDDGWTNPKRRIQLIEASKTTKKRVLAEKILAAVDDSDKAVARAAKGAVEQLKLEAAKKDVKDTTPIVGTLKVDDAIAAVLNAHGDRARGEALFQQVGCNLCHTTSPNEPPRGPILSQVATIFKRRDFAEAILLPSKTLAQGFVAERFTMKDETEYEGFITQEAADKVTIRNVAAQEIQLVVKDIVKRQKLDRSLMPEGLMASLTVKDFAALLDFLESLAKK